MSAKDDEQPDVFVRAAAVVKAIITCGHHAEGIPALAVRHLLSVSTAHNQDQGSRGRGRRDGEAVHGPSERSNGQAQRAGAGERGTIWVHESKPKVTGAKREQEISGGG
jgi:hypothetical protein